MWVRAQNGPSDFLRFGLSPGSFIILFTFHNCETFQKWRHKRVGLLLQSQVTYDLSPWVSVGIQMLPPRCSSAPSRPLWWCAVPCSQASGPQRRTPAQHSLWNHEVRRSWQGTPQQAQQPGGGGERDACWAGSGGEKHYFSIYIHPSASQVTCVPGIHFD